MTSFRSRVDVFTDVEPVLLCTTTGVKPGSRYLSSTDAIDHITHTLQMRPETKLLFLARHGQGYQNLYKKAFDIGLYDSCTIPIAVDSDPDNTPEGVLESFRTCTTLEKLYQKGLPRPEMSFSSPMRRAAKSAAITFAGQPIHLVNSLRPQCKGYASGPRVPFSQLQDELNPVLTDDLRPVDFDATSNIDHFYVDAGYDLKNATEKTHEFHRRLWNSLNTLWTQAETNNARVFSITSHSAVCGRLQRFLTGTYIKHPASSSVAIYLVDSGPIGPSNSILWSQRGEPYVEGLQKPPHFQEIEDVGTSAGRRTTVLDIGKLRSRPSHQSFIDVRGFNGDTSLLSDEKFKWETLSAASDDDNGDDLRSLYDDENRLWDEEEEVWETSVSPYDLEQFYVPTDLFSDEADDGVTFVVDTEAPFEAQASGGLLGHEVVFW